MKNLRIVLAAQLFIFIAWGGWLLSSRNTVAAEFYLETQPVDPRDLISGTFVALSYPIAAMQAGNCPALAGSRVFFVKLEDRGRTAATESGPAPIYEATDCAKEAPAGEANWARGESVHGFTGLSSALYGIERFYLNEDNPLKDARSGSVLSKVKIDRSRRLVLLDLVKKI